MLAGGIQYAARLRTPPLCVHVAEADTRQDRRWIIRDSRFINAKTLPLLQSPWNALSAVIQKAAGVSGAETINDRQKPTGGSIRRLHLKAGLVERGRQAGVHRPRMKRHADRIGPATPELDGSSSDQLVQRSLRGTVAIPATKSVLADATQPSRQGREY